LTVTVALPDSAMLDRLASFVDDNVDLVVWRPGDSSLETVIDLLVMPYTVSYESLKGLGGSAHPEPVARL
jgi:hypothetical protein